MTFFTKAELRAREPKAADRPCALSLNCPLLQTFSTFKNRFSAF